MRLSERANILFAIADKIRDDSEKYDAGIEKDKVFPAVMRRLKGLSDYSLEFLDEIKPKPKAVKKSEPKKKAAPKKAKK